MSSFSERIDHLSAQEKRVLLAQLLQEKASKTTVQQPLSYGQQALWFLHQSAPNSPAYNVAFTARLKGNLNFSALQQAVQTLVNRHGCLRTTFTMQDGNPVQIVHGYQKVDLERVDASTWSKDELHQQVIQSYKRPFDLENGPVLRVSVFTHSVQEHILLLTIHHIVCDGWSVRLMLDELQEVYVATANGTTPSLSPLVETYSDYINWQTQLLNGSEGKALWTYWQNQFSGELPVLNLPTDRPRPSVQTFNGASYTFRISKDLTQRLQQLTQTEGTTLYMTLLAAFQVLLHRYTGQEDILVGSPTTGRSQTEFANIVGYFVNPVVLRSNCAGDPTFNTFLAQVRQTALGAIAHQDYPFPLLVKQLPLTRDPSRSPLFQTLFVLQKPDQMGENVELLAGIEADVRVKWGDLELEPFPVAQQEGTFDLTLAMLTTQDSLVGILKYNTDLFNIATIERFANHFQILLDSITLNPEQRLSELSLINHDERHQLLTQWQPTPSLTAANEFANYRDRSNLTGTQLLIWLSQQLHPNSPLYNNASNVEIPTEIQLEYFQTAFQALINASDALRTVFVEVDGYPQRHVIPELSYTIECLDFSHASTAELQTWLHQHNRKPFDLAERLFDCVLIKTSEQAFVWYLKIHQIIADGFSFGLIFQYVSILYHCFLNKQEPDCFELPQFQDYVDYELDYQKSARYRKAEDYWTQKLAAKLDPISFYGRNPLTQTTQVQRVSYSLGQERSQRLKAIAAQHTEFGISDSTSLFNIFLAVLAAYLYRISGNRLISIGMPFHNRRSKRFKQTVGSFVQTVPLHIAINDSDTLQSLIERIANTTTEALRYGQYVLRGSQQQPLYNVSLNYELQTASQFQGVAIKNESIHAGHGTESLVIKIRDWDSSGELFLDFDFHQDIFDENLQSLTIQHFLQTLDTFLDYRAVNIDHIDLLSAEQKQHLLKQQQYRGLSETSVCRLFEAQVENTPHQIAVRSQHQSLTYAELNAKANQLAHYLRSLGVKPDTLVGICMDRSPEMILGVLAVLKAGGAYVPLDPAYPQERLNWMLEDSQLSVLLSKTTVDTSALNVEPVTRVYLDTIWDAIAEFSTENLLEPAQPNHLAYVIYTSGSTGKPKGVMIEHASLVNFTQAAIADYGMNAGDRVLQFASISFDAAAEEIYPCLATGGTLVLRTDEMLSSIATFLQTCQDWQLTVLDLPTAYWHQLVAEMATTHLSLPSSLRLVIIGGEKANPELTKLWQQQVGHTPRLLNTYGPTEATVVATTCSITSDTPIQQQVPIGSAIANVETYILDRNLQPVPIGVSGELHIGGLGLARGYLNAPELTQKAFIPHPFSANPQARLYKTGDLARYLSDGTIEFLGRTDDQVKVRGFRIELGEIEAALDRHPNVKQSAVVLRDGQGTLQQLVAYIVPVTTETSLESVREFVRSQLPDYMVPTFFIPLESLPLTANGKLDRRALPQPDVSQISSSVAYVAPRNEVEEKLAEIWIQILQVERVGIHDNFFELGGHSLMAAQVVGCIRSAFAVEIPLRSLFEAATIAQLGDCIETLLWAKSANKPLSTSGLVQGEL
jgi:amino acid adenylation domain-containing protein